MKYLFVLSALVAAALAYLLFGPSDYAPVSWQAPEPPAAAGIYAPNDALNQVERFGQIGLAGPEYVEMDQHHAYTGFRGGKIMRFALDGAAPPHEVANTQGRPLGMRLMRGGDLIVADAERGLLRVHPDGTLQVLVHELGGQPLGLVDDVVVSGDEHYAYFTEASRRFGVDDSPLDIIEHAGRGRLLRHDLWTGDTLVLKDQINFANGLAMAPDEAYLWLNETGSYRIRRYWLRGPEAGKLDTFADNLPGFPDNITCNGNDRVWVALVNPRRALLDRLASHPVLRKGIMSLPDFLRPHPNGVPQVVAFDLAGHPVAYLQGRGAGAYAPITTVREADGWLYLGSLDETSLARLRWPPL